MTRFLNGLVFVCVVGAVLLELLMLVGCSSPTAPSSTYRLTFAPAPGCSPGQIPSQPQYNPTATIQLPGSRTLTASWPGLTVEFLSFGETFLICKVVNQ